MSSSARNVSYLFATPVVWFRIFDLRFSFSILADSRIFEQRRKLQFQRFHSIKDFLGQPLLAQDLPVFQPGDDPRRNSHADKEGYDARIFSPLRV